MSDAKSPSDLSMDEILATIRRIIADEEQPGTSPGIHGAAAGRTGAAANTGGERAAPQQPPGGEDVLELTQALNEDGSVRHLAPIGGTAAQRATEEPEPPVAETRAPAEPAVGEKPAVVPTPARAGAVAPDDRVVSEVASFAAAAAFAHLAQVPHGGGQPREMPRIGDKTLETLVAELLRPLLKAWLDDNLPQLVERLVQAEITRFVNRSGIR